MSIHLQKKDCSGCGACASVCPNKCIDMKLDCEGFLYPHIDKCKCVECQLCEKICPTNNMPEAGQYKRKAFAAYCNDEIIRSNSSSGGMFTVLAQAVLQKGGVVCGAAFNEKQELEHIIIDTVEEIGKLQGSKYLQSKMGSCFQKVKDYLNEGRWVYFSGTPCQIDGLVSFLKKKYDNLITQDLICHGVPSPMIWEKYVDYQEKCASSRVERTFFRNKKYGWKMYSVLLSFINNTEYTETKDDDLFMKCFLQDLCLRPSCYTCHHKNYDRIADVTLADYWGIENEQPEMFDDRGTSLVIIHSEKGWKLFSEVGKEIIFRETEIENAIKYNPAYYRSAKCPEERNVFMKHIQKSGIEDAYNDVLDHRKKISEKREKKARNERRIRRYKRRIIWLWKKLYR